MCGVSISSIVNEKISNYFVVWIHSVYIINIAYFGGHVVAHFLCLNVLTDSSRVFCPVACGRYPRVRVGDYSCRTLWPPAEPLQAARQGASRAAGERMRDSPRTLVRELS